MADHPDFDISNHQVEIEPDPIDPKWELFRQTLTLHPAIIRVAQINGVAAYHMSQITAAMWQVDSNPSVMQDIATHWHYIMMIAPLTEAERSDINDGLTDCSMPFRLAENNEFNLGG